MRRSTDLGDLGFGLDSPDDRWLDELRAACEPRALGRIGEYELLDEVSRGGQGIVFRARQPGTQRDIALKRMLAGSFSTTLMRLRFEREVEAAAALSHPNIVTVYGMETVDGQPLPSLDLHRVFVLTGPNTCSASESIINSLRGVNVQVFQFGSTTCGKPYGFYPTDNCGTTYFTIQFRGINDIGFGDYSDGFSPQNTNGIAGVRVPGCSVGDDFSEALGDPAEARLAAALAYRDSPGTCPFPSGRPQAGVANLVTGDGPPLKNPWLTNRILQP